jgi:anti-sigma factor RsiW
MADREDIDALLVGALYGELDETDRARLDAHLASHPQDRMSLEAMRSTRGLVRDADLAAAMVEPPAAVSALLLQEAARRAPAVQTAGAGSSGGILGFLAGFLRPVMAHPALSAAAMLVVVAGTAGALYLSGNGRVVHPDRSLPAATASAGDSAPAATPAAMDGAGVDKEEWSAEPTALAQRAQLAASAREQGKNEAPALLDPGTGEGAESAAMLDSYRVSLDDGKDAQRAARDSGRELGFTTEQKPAVAKGSPETTATATGYIEVARADEPTVRAPHEEGDGDVTLARGNTTGGEARTASKLGQAQPQAPSPPPPAEPAPGSRPTAGLAGAIASEVDDTSALARSNGAVGSSAGSVAPNDPRFARPYNARSDEATLTWARDQHARMVKLVAAGKCNEAGSLGAQILRRAPDYYGDQVYNDRRIRACRAYVDKSRRATEPARKRDLPSPTAADEALAPDKAAN